MTFREELDLGIANSESLADGTSPRRPAEPAPFSPLIPLCTGELELGYFFGERESE